MEFDQILEEIAANEEQALELYQLPEDTPEDVLIDAFKRKGVKNWETNLGLLDSFEDFDIDDSFVLYLAKIRKYTELRKESFLLILRAIEEDSDDYNNKIDAVDEKIERLVLEIEGME